jgi:hypothetical protein
MSSRRQFIFDGSAVLAALAVAPWSAFSQAAAATGGFQSLAQMSYPVLAAQVNTRFRVRVSPTQVVSLKLLKAPLARPTPIRPGKPLPGDAGYEKFSLIFSGPNDALLASAIHPFEHDQLGRFEMFIAPIGIPQADGVRYQAGFSRPAPTASTATSLT